MPDPPTALERQAEIFREARRPGASPAGPADPQAVIRRVFESYGLADQADFALLVAQGESGFDPFAVGDNGRSHGVWQLYDQGLLPEFYARGYTDPYDVEQATDFVASYIAENGPGAWSNWTVARNLQTEGISPGTTLSDLGRSGPSSRFLYPEELAETRAHTGLLGEQTASERFGRVLDAATFAEDQRTALVARAKTKIDALHNVDELQQIRREAALDALINAAQYTVGPDMRHYPGLEPGGAGQVLGTLLGASVPSQRMPRTELPVRQMVEAPILANEQLINQMLNPLLGAATAAPRAA